MHSLCGDPLTNIMNRSICEELGSSVSYIDVVRLELKEIMKRMSSQMKKSAGFSLTRKFNGDTSR